MHTYFINKTDTGIIIIKNKFRITIDFVFQPIYCPKTRTIIYYELLSKLISESGTLYNNEDFFTNIDDIFLKKLCLAQLDYLEEIKIDKVTSINVTLSLLSDQNFIDKVTHLKSTKLALEINELNCEIDNKIKRNLMKLKNNNVMLWLDDYHSNYEQANLTLGVIDWDIIKIDKTFLHYNSENSLPIESLLFVLNPFTKNGLIFEGVETEHQNSLVRRCNSLAQGYYHSYPKPWVKIEGLIEA